ncbi:DUF7116 family protein [Salarchaeum japonicum]|uniref:DUF7116 family protein n=1 Tax=Salarchaeum japonicum TaxID=555573 RepID=UPI003C790900
MVSHIGPPSEEAKSIFADLGYSVAGDGATFTAARDWKEVEVLAVTDDVDTPSGDRMRCFVTWKDYVPDLGELLDRAAPDYDYAVIGVEEDGEYEVARAPSE